MRLSDFGGREFFSCRVFPAFALFLVSARCCFFAIDLFCMSGPLQDDRGRTLFSDYRSGWYA